MTSKITIGMNYNAYDQATFELPKGKTFADLEQWYVKWDAFNYKIAGEWYRDELNSGRVEVDTKVPTLTVISDTSTYELLAEQED
tara:strand:+ start:243 stop:497 length:255 start_codon:yes stop_codon:yes gene_type:complete